MHCLGPCTKGRKCSEESSSTGYLFGNNWTDKDNSNSMVRIYWALPMLSIS